MTNTSDLPHIRKQLGDRYAIERELGRGGMGAVYLARDLRLDRPVALNVLPAELAQRSLGRLVMAASGLSLLGVSFLLLARSPFRMPPGERLFRVVWLGAPGRAFVRFSSRNVTPPTSEKSAPGLARTRANVNIAEAGRAAAPVVATKATPTDRMRSLEDRVAALERWRDGAST